MSGAILRLSVFTLLVFSTLSQAADIPPDLDVSKYQEVHDKKKTAYEDSRTAANKKHSDYATRIREREDLEAEHTRLQAQIDRNESTIGEIEKNIEASISKQEGIRATINEAQAQYKELQAELNGLAASIRNAKTRLTTQDNTVAVSSQNKIAVESELQDARDAYSEASSSLKDASKWLGEVQTEQVNLANQLTELNKQLTTQRSQKVSNENENTLLVGRAERISEALTKQQSQLEKVTELVDKAERAQKLAETEVNQTNNQIAKNTQEIATAQQTVQEKRQAVRQAEKAVTVAEKNLADAEAASAALDTEKEELDTKISVLMPEVQRIQQDLDKISQQIGNVEEQLKTAEGDKKEQLEKRLANLKKNEQETQKDLQEKRGELQQTRRRLLAIPAEKAEKRRAEGVARRALAQAKEGVTNAEAEVTVAQDTVESLRKTERQLNRDLAAANQALTTANSNLKDVQQQNEGVKSRIKELRREQNENQDRQRELARLIRGLTQSINTLENDSIPSIQRAQTTNDAEVTRFTNDVARYTRQKSEKERLVSRLQVQLQNSKDILERDIRARDTIASELKGYTDREGEASSESDAILEANKVRERSIAQIEREQIEPAKTRVKEISDSNKELRVARDTKQKNIDAAIEIELFAKAAYTTAEETADTLQEEWNVASNELSKVKAAYKLGADRAIADGSAAGKAAGEREAAERAGAAAGGVGTTEGNFDGALEGGRGLKQKIYDEALEKAYVATYDSTKIEKELETLADKQARLNQAELQARFLAGQATGKDVGYRDGL
ncbi:MAG: hypothetical protein KDD39_12245, partial [Bdellovibrionales bacterium]|nr:hypothetical protein [Bdellovibrionales bacterium]